MDRYTIPKSRSVAIPLEPGERLTKEQCPEKDDINELSGSYSQLIGALMFVASRTRPDISFAVTALSQFSANPSRRHWYLLQKVLLYLYKTKELALYCERPGQSLRMEFFVDSSWASCVDDRCSWSGYVGLLGGIPVTWRVQKQKCITLSTMESEFVAVVTEMRWLHVIGKELEWMGLTKTPLIWCDNEATIAYTKNNMERFQTKHIDMRYKFVRKALQDEEFCLLHIPTYENVADVFTKPLPRIPFLRFREELLKDVN